MVKVVGVDHVSIGTDQPIQPSRAACYRGPYAANPPASAISGH
jgi:hypothetical protein